MLRNLITYQSFVYPFIPGDIARATTQDKITAIITTAQSEFIKTLIGGFEYEKLIADCSTGDYPTSEIWTEFIEGVEYTDNSGRTITYPGILSPLTKYCYSEIQNHALLQDTSVGTQFPDMENASKAFPNHKIVTAWNLMIDEIYHNYNSVYNYLTQHSDSYPDTVYTRLTYINSIGA